jgi:hypothetical protein
MRIVHYGHPQLRQERTCFIDVLSTRHSPSIRAYYNHTPGNSKLMAELKQIPDNSKNEGLIFTIYRQTRGTKKCFMGSLKESRRIN